MRTLLLAGLIVLPLSAHAIIINVEYSGTISSTFGHEVPYAVGDPISGTLQIDTDLAPADGNALPTTGSYVNGFGGDSGFVTGYAPAGTFSEDFVIVSDGVTDAYRVRDAGAEELLLNAIGSHGLEFITGDGISQSFVLTSADAPDLFGGHVRLSPSSLGARLASFDLTRLAVSPIKVPEPSVLLLFVSGLGAIGISLARRR